MKAVILCPKSPRTSYGGLENYSLHLAERLKSEGFSVEIFATSRQPADGTVNGILVREFPAFAPNDSYFLSLPLFHALRDSDADLVYSSGYNNLLTLAALLSKKKGRKVVVGMNLGGDISRFRVFLNGIFDRFINLFSSRIDAVICVCETELESAQKRLNVKPEKFHVVPMGIDQKAIQNVKAGKKGNYILSAGRFVRLKEFHHLIPAFSILAKKVPNVQLVLMGSGPMEQELREMVDQYHLGGRVVFEKPVPLQRIAELDKKIKESRLFVMLTDWGYEDIIGYEAIACEVPVLLCDSRGVMEYVKNGYAQAVKDKADYPATADKMMEMLENPEQFTPKNPAIHSWREVTGMVLGIFRGVLDGKP